MVAQKNSEYYKWLDDELLNYVEEFVNRNKILSSDFIFILNKIFNTKHFDNYAKKMLVEYMYNLFNSFYDNSFALPPAVHPVQLEDNALNRFVVNKYSNKYGPLTQIKWLPPYNCIVRMLLVIIKTVAVLLKSLKNGLKIFGKAQEFKVMREGIAGLQRGGYYLKDDYFVDGILIKKSDCLFYSRGLPIEKYRLKAFHELKASNYSHINNCSMPIAIDHLIFRIIPKYILFGSLQLFKEVSNPLFVFYYSLFSEFINQAIPYEQVFSNFKVLSEYGHAYFSSGHIAESIVCQNHGTKYYLAHWSDHSMKGVKHITAYLACDKYLLWGKAHIQGAEGDSSKLLLSGYLFKRFIEEVKQKKEIIKEELGIKGCGKIISFYPESFGGECPLSEEQHVKFWELALNVALKEKECSIIIKPKELIDELPNLSAGARTSLQQIDKRLAELDHVHVINPRKWSFIETIGISDIVITQSMTSSATIAIICGIEGLYFDQAKGAHPFSTTYKDKLVFDDPQKIMYMIHEIVAGNDSPLNSIPKEIIRNYDAYSDDRGIDVLRGLLSGQYRELAYEQKKVGVIVQARTSSTRLPGKVLKELPYGSGISVLEQVIRRLKRSKKTDEIIIATTTGEEDDGIVQIADKEKVKWFRGSKDDVLSRYYFAAKENKLDIIVRITSDCPCIDAEIMDKFIQAHLTNKVDYTQRSASKPFAHGLDVEVFSFWSLEKAHWEARLEPEREHVTPYIYNNPAIFKILKIEAPDNMSFPDLRLTLDTEEDYAQLCILFSHLYPMDPYFSASDIYELFNDQPWIKLINKKVVQKRVFNTLKEELQEAVKVLQLQDLDKASEYLKGQLYDAEKT